MHKKIFRTASASSSSRRQRMMNMHRPNNYERQEKSKSKSTTEEKKTSKKSPLSFRGRDKKGCSSTASPPQQQQLHESAFDPWASSSSNPPSPITKEATSTFSPTSVTDSNLNFTRNNYNREEKRRQNGHQEQVQQQQVQQQQQQQHRRPINDTVSRRRSSSTGSSSTMSSSGASSSSRRIIPGVSKMTMRQTLAVIFSAYWERADLYTDVLALDHDKPSSRQLRLAFFRQGRIVLATPIESPDDMTTIDAGMKPMLSIHSNIANNNSNNNEQNQDSNVVQSGVKVSRKAKMKFQAINLAYDLLNDEAKRKLYDEWKMWHCRLPPPSPNQSPNQSPNRQSQQQQQQQQQYEQVNQYQKLSNDERSGIINESEGNGNGHQNQYSFMESSIDESNASASPSIVSSSATSKSSVPSILREPTFGRKKKKKKKKRGSSNSSRGERSSSSSCSLERKIRWNEEVEELVILECSNEYSNAGVGVSLDLPQSHNNNVEIGTDSGSSRDSPPSERAAYNPFSSFDSAKENVVPADNNYDNNGGGGSNLPDPYANSSVKDRWFGNDKNVNQLSEYQRDTNRGKINKRNNKQNDASAFSSSKAESFNFHSLDDSTITFVDSSSSGQQPSNRIKSTLDDSLVAILDSPINQTTKPRHSLASLHVERKRERERARGSPNVLVDEKNFNVAGKGHKSNVKINVRTYQKESSKQRPQYQFSPATGPSITTTTYMTDPNGNVSDPFQNQKEGYELDADEFSLDTRSTYESSNWRSSFGQSADASFANNQNDCAVFGSANDCMGRSKDCVHSKINCMGSKNDTGMGSSNDCGSIDLAKGFQASLSNYINAAVSDMKEGFSKLGKKWEENVPKMSENGENPFIINPFEIDAMMDILKVEMNNFTPNMSKVSPFDTGCGAQAHVTTPGCGAN